MAASVTAGAAALDAHVARKAAEAGLDLTFLRTIPGASGGAVAMNAGCYGTYVADALESVTLVLRDGTVTETLRPGYRLGDLVVRAAQVAVGRRQALVIFLKLISAFWCS